MRAGAAVCLVALGACKLGAAFDDARFRCSETSPCPSGRTCLDGYCELEVPIDGEPPAPAVLGDVLTFTFDDGELPSFRDRSGHRFDCSSGGTEVDVGVYGTAAYLEPSNYLAIPDQPELYLGDQLTIEAWLFRDAAGEVDPIFGDRTVDVDEVAAEYALETTSDDRLRFTSNNACVAGPGEIAESAADRPVPAGQWTHVAVAWDGAFARFYLDGEPAGEVPLEATPCELVRNVRIGRLQGSSDELTMIGRIDEVKLSSLAKRQEDIRASMAYDTAAIVPRCGDRIIEGEGCDGDDLCCDSDACDDLPDGEACGAGGATVAECQGGICQVDPTRPSDGLVARYELEEGGGTVVADSSDVGTPVNLNISNPGEVVWGDGFLELETDTIVSSASGASKITDRCSTTRELTIDAWIQPATANQAGQIVAMGNGDDSEFGLQQDKGSWAARVRSSGTSTRGTPHVMSAAGDVRVELTHLVVRREATGLRTLFVNGRERGINVAPGGFENWGNHVLAIGDESGGTDPWRGRVYRVAIYCRALTDLEVVASFRAGHQP